MSRIIVKNLPKNLSDERFRKHFADHSSITDAKLMRTKSGQSRRFGFIGLRSAEDAEEAVKYFNRTFIDMSRIDVAIAKATTDPTLQKNRVERAPARIEPERAAKRAKVEAEPADPKLQEYLTAMKPRQNEKTWANEDFGADAPATAAEPVIPSDDDDDEVVAMPAAAQPAAPEEQMMSLDDLDAGEELTAEEKAAQAAMTDDEWLMARRKRMSERDPAAVAAAAAPAVETAATPAAPAAPAAPAEVVDARTPQEIAQDKIRETRRLFIRNISYSTREEDFAEEFGRFGPIEEVHMPLDADTQMPKGFVYIQFADAEDACQAYLGMDGHSFQGRLLHVLPGQAKRENKIDEIEMAKLPLKKQVELKRKMNAAKNQFQWNSLYMSADAVVDSLAHRMGVSKAELLDPQSSDAAVRQAMAESNAITDAKKYFESAGIDLDAFKTGQRSDTVILVKNFPFQTTVDELQTLFQEYGQLTRVLMPPANTIAVVEFLSPAEARLAFAKLAFRRFKNSVLYLEKGPKDLFRAGASALPMAPSAAKVTAAKPSVSDIAAIDDDDEALPTDMTSLFVKNLNFKTRTADLAGVFKPLDGFLKAEVKMKKNPKAEGELLSMGFGFVEFRSRDTAVVAMKTMAGFVLDGHELQIKVSTRGLDAAQARTQAESAKKDKEKRSKIIIKNLPFEASKKDVRQLFGAFGQLRTVRLPKKFDNSARGFAFAEFVSSKEAENAMAALSGVHLLGRRLVLQYASAEATAAEDQIADMQRKVQGQIAGQALAKINRGGKRKFDVEGNDDDEFGDD
ncbi:uncharacterized protein V1510DRAFT_416531 [Dipodascopsis tothii]|uniref:uncharacterized protein n=1 Tax=Dipodascopsis tothii TaxID=44089 RepID=UPI0034CD07F8